MICCSKQMSVSIENCIYIQPRGYCIALIKSENEIETLYYMSRNDTLEFGRDMTSNPNLSYMPAPRVISKDINFLKEKYGVFYKYCFRYWDTTNT